MTKEVMKPVSAATKSSPRVGTSIERFGVKAIGPISPPVEKAVPRMVTTLVPRGEMAQPFLRSPFETRKNTTGFSERKVPKATFQEALPVWKASREKTAIKKPVMSFQIAKELAIKQARPRVPDRKPEITIKSDWKKLATPKPEVTIFSVPIKKTAEQKISTIKRAQGRKHPEPQSQPYQVRRREYNPVTILPKFDKIQPQWKKSQARKLEQSRQPAFRVKLDTMQTARIDVTKDRQRKPEWRPTTEWITIKKRPLERLSQVHSEVSPIKQPARVTRRPESIQKHQHIKEVRRQLRTISQIKPRKEQSITQQQSSREQKLMSLQQLQERLRLVMSKKDKQSSSQTEQEALQAKMIKRQQFEQQQLAKLQEKKLKQKQQACAAEQKKPESGYIRDESVNRRRIMSLKMIFKHLSRNNQPIEAKTIADRIPKKQPSSLKSWIVERNQDDHSLEWFKMDFGQSRKIRSVEDIDMFATYSTQKYPAASITRGKPGDLSTDYVNKYVYGRDFVKPKEFTE